MMLKGQVLSAIFMAAELKPPLFEQAGESCGAVSFEEIGTLLNVRQSVSL
jgi:hypothetical protein